MPHGVILDRPLEGEFPFPVVTGFAETMPRDDREQAHAAFHEFLKDIDLARPGASDQVSEVDLSDAKDFARRHRPAWPGSNDPQAVPSISATTISCNKYRLLRG